MANRDHECLRAAMREKKIRNERMEHGEEEEEKGNINMNIHKLKFENKKKPCSWLLLFKFSSWLSFILWCQWHQDI